MQSTVNQSYMDTFFSTSQTPFFLHCLFSSMWLQTFIISGLCNLSTVSRWGLGQSTAVTPTHQADMLHKLQNTSPPDLGNIYFLMPRWSSDGFVYSNSVKVTKILLLTKAAHKIELVYIASYLVLLLLTETSYLPCTVDLSSICKTAIIDSFLWIISILLILCILEEIWCSSFFNQSCTVSPTGADGIEKTCTM